MNTKIFNEVDESYTHAFVIEIAEDYYLTETGSMSAFNHARIVRSPGVADRLAKAHNGTKRLVEVTYQLI